jgi:tetratricopeptide (TPR) repeat protein
MRASLGTGSSGLRHAGRVIIAAAALIALFAYLPGADGPLVLDDHPQLGWLLGPAPVPAAAWFERLFSTSGLLGRPVAMASFLLNRQLGGTDIATWKVINILLHLLNGALAFLLSDRLLHAGRAPAIGGDARVLAGVIAAIWLLHPLHVSTVLYLVQRMTLLAALFTLLGLILYVAGRERQIRDATGGVQLLLAFGVCFPLAAFSKETGLLFPLYALLIELLLFRFAGSREANRQLAAYFILTLLAPLLAGGVYLAGHFDQVFTAAYENRGYTLQERLFTESRALLYYLSLIVLPAGKRMGFFHDDFVVSTGLLSPPTTLGSILALVALLYLAYHLRARLPLVALGISLFFAGHLLESTVFPLELVYEHRNYLPAYGIMLAVVILLAALPWRRWLMGAMAAAAVLTFAWATHALAMAWSHEVLLHDYIYRAHPGSPRIRAVLAERLTHQGQYQAALDLLAPANHNGALLQRLYIRCRRDGSLATGDLGRATAALRPPLDDLAVTGLIELARVGLDGFCRFPPGSFEALLRKANSLPVTDAYGRQKLWLYRAHYLWRLGRQRDAIATLDTAYEILPANPTPLFLATEWLLCTGDIGTAGRYYESALEAAGASGLGFDEPRRRIEENLRDAAAGRPLRHACP